MTRILIYGMPYAAYIFLLFSLSIQTDSSIKQIVQVSGLAIALSLLTINIIFCIRLQNTIRKEAVIGLSIASIIIFVFLVIAEWMLPPVYDEDYFSKTQKNLQLQLQRRYKQKTKLFRGEKQQKNFNGLGWADKQRDYEKITKQIVFIGDSFLEVRSANNLAEISGRILARQGRNKEIINLSQSDTGLESYRYKFEEFALPLKPEHIYLFIYEGNDFVPGYNFQTYKHPQFYVSEQALYELKVLKLSPEALQLLQGLHKEVKRFHNREQFIDAITGLNLRGNLANLMYMYCYAYSYPPRVNTMNAGIFPKFFFNLGNLSNNVIDYFQSFFNQKSTQRRPSWRALYSEYANLFSYPKKERLNRIAEFVCLKYLMDKNEQRCVTILKAQEQRFIAYLIAEADMPYYFFPAMNAALKTGNKAAKKSVDTAQLNKTAQEYAKLLSEMSRTAEHNGIGFTLVLIPEASYADKDFYEFWLPLFDFNHYMLEKHILFRMVKEKVAANLSVIDLGGFSDQFNTGYWKFDGHWNEQGNTQAAEIITSHIMEKSR